jgi:effector-binding domain-containing protein
VPPLEVTLMEVPAIPLAVVRRQVPQSELPRVVPECCGLVWQAMRAQGARAGRHVALYWDAAVRAEIGVEAEGPFAEREGLLRSATPGGLVATVVCLGPYATLRAAHRAVRDWAATSGRRLAGPNWEIYGHWQAAWNTDPTQIRTEVYYQVAPV